jgi:hypothetical protein
MAVKWFRYAPLISKPLFIKCHIDVRRDEIKVSGAGTAYPSEAPEFTYASSKDPGKLMFQLNLLF